MARNIICYDAGFVHLGYMVAELPDRPDGKPKPIDLGMSAAELPKKTDRVFHRKTVTQKNIYRILQQVRKVEELHHTYHPVGYFIEMPHGGAKGALAIRGMSFATAYLATAIHMLSADICCTVFLPNKVKEAVTGDRNASKLDIARAVIEYWPEVGDWPGFKVIDKRKSRKGEKIVVKDKAIAHDATDAGAVCIAATQHDSYLQFFYGVGTACINDLV